LEILDLKRGYRIGGLGVGVEKFHTGETMERDEIGLD